MFAKHFFINNLSIIFILFLACDTPQLNAVAQPMTTSSTGYLSTREASNSAFDFMSDAQIADIQSGTAVLDVTFQLQSAIDHARSLPNPILRLPYGKYRIKKLNIPSRLLIISEGATLVGSTKGTFNAILDLTDCSNFNVSGKLYINGSYNPNYTYGVLVATSTSQKKAQYNNLENISISSVMTAFGFGSELFPAAIVSENTLIASQTYDTPNVIKAYGINTFVNVIGSVIDSTASPSWGRNDILTQYSVYSKGAKVLIVGGEVLHTTHPQIGSAFCLDAISKDGTNNYYGEIYVNNSEIETSAPLLTTINSSSLQSPTGGEMSLIGNTGWNGNKNFAYIQTGNEYTGRVYVHGNHFYAGAERMASNISIRNVHCIVDVDDGSFAKNYKRGLGGIVGGTIKFVGKTLLDVSELQVRTLPASTSTTLVYGAYINDGNNSRFAVNNYNSTTGVFNVPLGGLEDVIINVMFGADQNPVAGSSLGIYVNGVVEYQIDFSGVGKTNSLSGAFGKLKDGDAIDVRFFNNGKTPITLMEGTKLNRLVVFGSSR